MVHATPSVPNVGGRYSQTVLVASADHSVEVCVTNISSRRRDPCTGKRRCTVSGCCLRSFSLGSGFTKLSLWNGAGTDAGLDAFPDELALVLGKGRHEAEHERLPGPEPG